MAFLKVSEDDQIDPALAGVQNNTEAQTSRSPNIESAEDGTLEPKDQAKLENEETLEEKTKRVTAEAEKKALARGLNTLEILFPKAGWDNLASFPDLYPYFAGIFDLRKGFVYIAPTDPLHQIYILMRIIAELFFGLRYVSFGRIVGADSSPDTSGDTLTNIITNWQYSLQNSFDNEYLPRMSEYIRLLEGSPEDWNSPYTKKLVTDLHWTKRLYFLPYYKFQSIAPPSFQKKSITPIYPEIQKLRRYLAAVGISIEKGNHAGGAETNAHCDGIDNPWDRYVFQVPNPVSTRINALLAQKNRTNASLVFFTLATVTVLDNLVNDEKSWAYTDDRPGPLFRSVNNEGIRPLTGVDTRIDANALFKAALKKRQPPKEEGN
jgi:hypothetical protein